MRRQTFKIRWLSKSPHLERHDEGRPVVASRRVSVVPASHWNGPGVAQATAGLAAG